MISKRFIRFWMFTIIISMLFISCSPQEEIFPTDTLSVDPTQAPTEVPPTPTTAPRSLTVCLGLEPQTLYLYGGSGRSMWSVLESIYDGPFDTRSFSVQPVILEKLPSFSDGDAIFQPVEVQAGSEVVNADGELVPLQRGTLILPSGCTTTDCAVEWDGNAPVQMDQMVVRFTLTPDVTWSDGTPLTAEDSVFSYNIAAETATPVSKYNIYRTQSYLAADGQTVEWVGQPGFFPKRYETLFWTPLPRHKLEGLSPEELLTAEESSRKPLGWGPYVIQDWISGDRITLQKNSNYFRAEEGLPHFDTVEYLFLGEHADGQLAGVLEGKCDVVDNSADLVEQLEPIIEQSRAGKLKYFIGQGPEFEHVSFGIRPASYDDGYNPYGGERLDYFSDVRVRKAFAYCMNRPWAITDILIDESIVPATYIPPSHLLYLEELQPLPYDVAEGQRLLDEAGWRDLDNDPATPRQALGVPGVFDGTPLEVSYATTFAQQRVEVAEIIIDSMRECGIQVNMQNYNPGELFAPGPDGLVFGRNFDLVHFGWEVGAIPACSFYETDQIPDQENNWLGVNITGYSNPEYDRLCREARQSRPDNMEAYNQNYAELQRLFVDELPVVPLYFRLQMAMSRPDFCGMSMDVTARSALWNMESFDYGDQCLE